jgi:hypothetical protein
MHVVSFFSQDLIVTEHQSSTMCPAISIPLLHVCQRVTILGELDDNWVLEMELKGNLDREKQEQHEEEQT